MSADIGILLLRSIVVDLIVNLTFDRTVINSSYTNDNNSHINPYGCNVFDSEGSDVVVIGSNQVLKVGNEIFDLDVIGGCIVVVQIMVA